MPLITLRIPDQPIRSVTIPISCAVSVKSWKFLQSGIITFGEFLGRGRFTAKSAQRTTRVLLSFSPMTPEKILKRLTSKAGSDKRGMGAEKSLRIRKVRAPKAILVRKTVSRISVAPAH